MNYSELHGGGEERTVLGGLKTKSIDVVVAKDGIGPVLAVSMKGTLNAFRNLTNRMEEAVGDCTNLHIAYPAPYMDSFMFCANHEDEGIPPNDIAIYKSGAISEGILRYGDVMTRLAGRNDIRDATTKYEAVAICLVDPRTESVGSLITAFPSANGLLDFTQFFERLYEQYDQRFIYAAPGLAVTTRRLEWDADSPVLRDSRISDYLPRVSH